MRRIFSRMLPFALLALLFVGSRASADVLMPNMKLVGYCAQLENLADFPDAVFVGVIRHVTGGHRIETYIIKPEACLTKGYKFNSFEILAIPKERVADLGGLDPAPSWALPLSERINPADLQMSRNDPTASIRERYRVLGFSGDRAVVYRAIRITRFADGRPEERITYPAPAASGLGKRMAKP